MKCRAIGKTDVGRKRDHNEDHLLMDPKLGVYIVCDGMGGHAAGEVASEMAAKTILAKLKSQAPIIQQFSMNPDEDGRDAIKVLLDDAIQSATATIYEEAAKDSSKRGMGTTLAMMLVCGRNAFVAHVGDARVYLLREGKPHQLTEDHSFVNEMVKQGLLSKAKAQNHPRANVITRAVGIQPAVQADILPIELMGRDKFILCSDGLTEYVNGTQILEMSDQLPTDALPTGLIEKANAGGGKDNITVLTVEITTDGQAKEEAHSQALAKKIETLQKIPLFSKLDYQQLVKVLEIVQVRSKEAGKPVVRDGEDGQEMYIILHGHAVVQKCGKLINTLNPGDFFGEMALIDMAKRSADVIAKDKLKVLILNRDPLFSLLQKDPRMSTKVFWAFLKRLNKALRAAENHLYGKQSAPAKKAA